MQKTYEHTKKIIYLNEAEQLRNKILECFNGADEIYLITTIKPYETVNKVKVLVRKDKKNICKIDYYNKTVKLNTKYEIDNSLMSIFIELIQTLNDNYKDKVIITPC